MAANARMVEVIDRFGASLGIAMPRGAGDGPGDGIAGRWAALRAAGVDSPGLAFAEWVDLAVIGGVVPPLLANTRDVASLLAALGRYHPLWGDDEIVVAPTVLGGVRVALAGPEGRAVHPDTLDAFFTLLARLLDRLTVTPVRGRRRRRPDALEFGPGEVGVAIAAADPAIARLLEAYADAAVDDRAATIVTAVRTHLREDLARPPTLAQVAARLAHSPRTVQDRLAADGTTFSDLLDDERRLCALGLLAQPDLAVTVIAGRVGFASVEGFSRAVRRWTGSSPTAWRASAFGAALPDRLTGPGLG